MTQGRVPYTSLRTRVSLSVSRQASLQALLMLLEDGPAPGAMPQLGIDCLEFAGRALQGRKDRREGNAQGDQKVRALLPVIQVRRSVRLIPVNSQAASLPQVDPLGFRRLSWLARTSDVLICEGLGGFHATSGKGTALRTVDPLLAAQYGVRPLDHLSAKRSAMEPRNRERCRPRKGAA